METLQRCAEFEEIYRNSSEYRKPNFMWTVQ